MKQRQVILGLLLLTAVALIVSGCFGPSQYRITIDIIGQGQVEVDPEAASYAKDTVVTLRAIPDGDFAFVGWDGDLTGAEPEQTVVMTKNLHIIAEFELPPADATISGVVTKGRGGPPVAGAEVRWSVNYATTTDAQGAFTLPVNSGFSADVMIYSLENGVSKIQDVHPEAGEDLYFEVPIRQAVNPNWSLVPPTITVNVSPYDVLSGVVAVEVSAAAETDIFVMYAYYNGEQRFPAADVVIEGDELEFAWDTRLEPNGPGYLRILAYDNNENATLYRIPVEIDNAPGDPVDLPGQIPWLVVWAETFGENIVFFSEPNAEASLKRPDREVEGVAVSPRGMAAEPLAAPPNAMIRIFMEWGPVQNAQGYKVYRSFDGVDYRPIATISNALYDAEEGVFHYDDYSPLLEDGQQTWYKIVPYNYSGEGPAFQRHVTPLPSYNIQLLEPAHQATDVDLFPTFRWDKEASGPFPEDTDFVNFLTIYDPNWWYILGVNEQGQLNFGFANEWEYALAFDILWPGSPYTWDIAYSYAQHVQTSDEFGLSWAWSDANWLWGSQGGEAAFTTALDDE